jgi:hypothetical protein
MFLIVVTFIIGVVGLGAGSEGLNWCTPNLTNSCYKIFDGTVYGYSVTENSCSKCISTQQGTGNCNGYEYYNCYTSYANVRFGSHNESCYIVTSTRNSNEDEAIYKSHSYYIGEYVKLYDDNNGHECDTGDDTLDFINLWWTGVGAMSCFGCLLLAAPFVLK